MPGTNDRLRNNGQGDRTANQHQLEGRVDLGDLSRLDLSRGERKVPVPSHSLGRWKRDPTVIDSRDG